MPVHDNWWQTETGGIMIANYRSMDVRPGSMGRPLPGIEAAVARRDEDDDPVLAPTATLELVEDPGEEGELVLRPGWPSMFRGYLGEEERYRKCFAGGWYLTGDLVRRDRRRLLLVRRPRRRRDQVGRAPDRTVRGRERAARAPGGRRGGRDRQARPGRRR